MRKVIPINMEVRVLDSLLDMELYVVGGCVRDALFEHFHGFTFDPKDYDLATPEHPDAVLEVLRSPKCRHNGIKALEVGKAFGVVVAVFPSGNEYEIATFREEWYDPDAGDGRRPDEVKFSTPEADAQRRDLTINSLFYNIVDGEIVDHVGTGISDIENIIIRPPGDPSQRYREDRLRVLRTARFFSRYRSDLATEHLTDETLQAISEWKHLPGVSLERVVAEFCSGIKQAIQPDHFLASLQNLDLYDAIFPDRSVNSLGFAAKTRSPAVVLACLLHEHRKGLNKYLNGRTYDRLTCHKAQFLSSLFDFEPSRIVSYINSRDRHEVDMYDDAMELCETAGLDQEEIENMMRFRPKACRDDFPEMEEGPELGLAIKNAIEKEYLAAK